VVKTAPKGNSYEIVSWLPDNQQVLIVEDLRGSYVQNNSNSPQESINLYNTEKNEVKVYAIPQGIGNTPSWSSALNAVVYPVMHYYDIDRKNQSYKFTHQIWVSYGNPDNVQLLKENLSRQILVTVKPDGSQFVYSENDGEALSQLYIRSVSHGVLGAEQLLPVDVPHVKYAGQSMNYTMIWRPNTSQLFFYSSYANTTNLTFLLDINGRKSCALDFDGWVYFARWSPNGRYLAVVKSVGPNNPLWVNYDLNVLDTMTGELHKVNSAKIDPPHLAHLVSDLSWAPDNHHLAIIEDAYATSTSPPPSIDRLYLVDIISGEVSNPFPDYQFNIGWWGTGLAWSPDGSKILIRCPTHEVDKICLVPVHISGK
jgi:Tol biopolymer transport system component